MASLPLIVMAIGLRLTSLDPFVLTGLESFQATGNVIEPLARPDPATKALVPWLAERWEMDRAHKSFRVHLRPNVRFHDGSKLTAEDVKFTFEAYYAPEFKGEVWRGMWNDVERVTMVDPLTVEFHCKRLRYLVFENVMTSLRILSRAAYVNSTAEERRSRLVGTGPFRLKRFDPGRALELEPSLEWWGDNKPRFRLAVKSVPEVRLAQDMLSKGELDFYQPGALELLPAKPSSKYKVFVSEATVGKGLSLELNLRLKLFQDKRVRDALVRLWDRERLNRTLFDSKYRVAVDMFSPKLPAYPQGVPPPYDPKRADQLLTEAGWTDPHRTGVREHDGLKLEFTLLVNNASLERWASLYQSDAAKLGVRVKLERLEEDAQWWKRLNEGRFDVVAQFGGLNTSVHAAVWSSKGPYNTTGFSDPAVDAQIEALENEFDPKRRDILTKDLIRKLRAYQPDVPGLLAPTEALLVSQRLDLDPRAPLQPWGWRLSH